jgi:hypothetical protein
MSPVRWDFSKQIGEQTKSGASTTDSHEVILLAVNERTVTYLQFKAATVLNTEFHFPAIRYIRHQTCYSEPILPCKKVHSPNGKDFRTIFFGSKVPHLLPAVDY